MKTRKQVRTHLVRKNGMGEVRFVRIDFTDGTHSYGCSFPGGLALFGTDRARAWKEATERPHFGDPGFCNLPASWETHSGKATKA